MIEISLKSFRIINYLVIASIVLSSLLLTRTIISTSFSAKHKNGRTDIYKNSDSDIAGQKSIMHYSGILENNPFGPSLSLEPLFSAKQPDKQEKTSPISSLVLVGTAAGSGNTGYAVFMDKAGESDEKQEIFTYGDMVFNYGILREIRETSVTIDTDSYSHTITIDFESSENRQTSAPAKKRFTKNSSSSKKSFARKVGEHEYVLDSRKVQQSLENPDKLLTDARLLPVIKDGKQEGFRISEVVPDGIYHSLGMQNGDTLLKINGLEISNPEVAIQAMSALKGMDSIDLDIVRDGTRMSLNYQIK